VTHPGSYFDRLYTDLEGTFLSGSADGTIRRWSSHSGDEQMVYTWHSQRIFDIVLLNDGTSFLSASADGAICQWGTFSGGPYNVFRVNENPVTALAVISAKPDDFVRCFLSAGKTPSICKWNLLYDARQRKRRKDEKLKIFTGVPERTGYLLLLKGEFERTFLSGSADSGVGTIRHWNVDTGALIMTYKGHTTYVTGLEDLEDGTFLSVSADCTICRWCIKTGECMHTFDCDTHSKLALFADRTFLSLTWAKRGIDHKDLSDKIVRTYATPASTPSHMLVLPDDTVLVGCCNGTIYHFQTPLSDTKEKTRRLLRSVHEELSTMPPVGSYPGGFIYRTLKAGWPLLGACLTT